MTTDKQAHGERLAACFALAIGRAIELDYAVETMKITVSPSSSLSGSDTVAVHLAPIPPAGTIMLGGAVTIEVDLGNQEIANVTRHQ